LFNIGSIGFAVLGSLYLFLIVEGMKLRNMKSGEEKEQKRTTSAEDDLKWVEEHIPSGVDAALPSLLDSDEELMTTKFEMSKID
jgi:hypothetical protein